MSTGQGDVTTMTDYENVRLALAGGADPAFLCATCPWTRTCVSPPTMTRQEIDEHIQNAWATDARAAGEAHAAGRQKAPPVGAMVTALTLGGRDMMTPACPVFTLRLRSSDGRRLTDQLKGMMQQWDDD
jgi:hypothetical protein